MEEVRAETKALVADVTEREAFLWSRDYGRIFQPGSGALALGRNLPNHERMPRGSWIRVRVRKPETPSESGSWLGEAMERVESPPEPYFSLVEAPPLSSGKPLRVAGIAVVCPPLPSGAGLLYSPVLGYLRYPLRILQRKAPPAPLILVRFTASAVIDSVTDRQFSVGIKFKADSISKYKGAKETCGVREFRCLARDARLLNEEEGIWGFLAQADPGLKIKAGRQSMPGLPASLAALPEQAYNVYAVPRGFTLGLDKPGERRPCEWEAIFVRASSSSVPLPSVSPAHAASLIPSITPTATPTRATSSSSSPNPVSSPPQTSAASERQLVEDTLLQTMLDDPEILAIITRKHHQLFAQYLNLSD